MKGTSPTVAALGAYTPAAASSLPKHHCGEYLVLTPDAIGRLRERCPRCDGVAHRVTRHPDDAMMPQGLVRVQPLPAIESGQLRCQVCARGVDGNVRFHEECRQQRKRDQMVEFRGRHATPWTCEKCGSTIPRKRGRPPKCCERCR